MVSSPWLGVSSRWTGRLALKDGAERERTQRTGPVASFSHSPRLCWVTGQPAAKGRCMTPDQRADETTSHTDEAAHQPAPASPACCPAVAQESCCTTADKRTCCVEPTGERCGCR